MKRLIFSVLLSICLISIAGRALSQGIGSNSGGSSMWPSNPPVGIGTQLSGGVLSALHIHHDPTRSNWPAILRLSEGDSTDFPDWGILGIMPSDTADTMYSSLTRGYDLILHDEQDGDIIITNYSHRTLTHTMGGAIRFATTLDSAHLPNPSPGHHDCELMTILGGNGNIGFDLPPNDTTGLGKPMDQIHIGGGVIPPPGELDGLPGLTIYGGTPFEGMLLPGIAAGIFPIDSRYIGFNYANNHALDDSTRNFRLARTSSSAISFGEGDGASIDLGCYPYDSTRGKGDFRRSIHLHFMGNKGLELFKDVSDSDQNHHLFECWVPGFQGYGTDSLRNVNGLFIHHTPVLITGGTSDYSVPNFTNLANVKPDMGDDSTWLLAVEGPALFKEAFVNSANWPDYVFDPGYKLPPLDEFENFIEENHHLPDIPSAKQMDTTGIPLGRTEAALTKQVEEMALYIIKLNKEVEALKTDIQDLKSQKEK